VIEIGGGTPCESCESCESFLVYSENFRNFRNFRSPSISILDFEGGPIERHPSKESLKWPRVIRRYGGTRARPARPVLLG
jgi:hypothetical protein